MMNLEERKYFMAEMSHYYETYYAAQVLNEMYAVYPDVPKIEFQNIMAEIQADEKRVR